MASRLPKSKHGLHPLQYTHKALERIGIKSGCVSIRSPPGSNTASPQLASRCVGDLLAANATFSNRPAEETGLRLLFQRSRFRWRSSVLTQTPTPTKLAAAYTPAMNSATNF